MKKKELQEEIDRLRQQVIECHRNNESLYKALLECTCPASHYVFKYSPKLLRYATDGLAIAQVKEKNFPE